MLLEVYLSFRIFPNLDDLLFERTYLKKKKRERERKISQKAESELTNYVTKLLRIE